jgi:siroheme decarboxylase
MIILTPFQKTLCNTLQNGLPIVTRPFAEIACQLNSDESTVISETKKLFELRLFRRISVTVNYRALGKTSALVAAHVEESQLPSVVAGVNDLVGVSHNYLRDHYYNLWFTLQAASQTQIERVIAKLAAGSGIAFYALPAIQTFKLDVRFDAESDGKSLLPCEQNVLATECTEHEAALLSEEETAVLRKLQQNLEIVPEPFPDALPVILNLFEKGVIRRMAVVVDYRRLGFAANAMFVCAVEEERMTDVGRRLAELNNVSHCYRRSPFPGWSYNLFGMMHGRDMAYLENIVGDFTSAQKIRHYALLRTLQEFKKKPVNV